ncbi:MAG: hypothetical protein AAB426_04690, partial [Myxococcota bacterium]
MMSMTRKKALSDLRLQPRRFALAVVALTIGIWGSGSIATSYYVLSRDLKQNYADTLPAHAILSSADFGRLDLKALSARPDVEAAELRDFSIHRIEVAPDEWIPLWLFGVRDLGALRVARFYPDVGATRPTPGSILVERVSLRI